MAPGAPGTLWGSRLGPEEERPGGASRRPRPRFRNPNHMLSVVALLTAIALPLPATATVQEKDRKAEYEVLRDEAGEDAGKLWRLFNWCEAHGLDREGRSILRAITKVDDSKKAHELLGEILHDGRWFANQRKVEDYRKRKLDEEARRTGKVVYEGRLVEPGDVPRLERGMVKTDEGDWITAQDHTRRQQGWVRQDFEWISPDEVAHVAKGLFKCGDQWLALEEANEYHSELGKWWRIPSEHFVLYSTCDRDTTERAAREAERAHREQVRVFGRVPEERVALLVLNSREQYGRFATGTEHEQVEVRGFSSLHGAFVAELWAEPYASGLGTAGVAYWDAAATDGVAFGRTFVRHAAGQSVVEALDPSPRFLANMAGGRVSPDLFWEEKKLPEWFRCGAAVYAERYAADNAAPDLEGGPLALRARSIDNLRRMGGLDPFERIFEFRLTLEDRSGSSKLMNQAGLLVAFIIDGDCKPVVARHLALKNAIKKRKGVERASRALEKEIVKNESQLRAFSGL